MTQDSKKDSGKIENEVQNPGQAKQKSMQRTEEKKVVGNGQMGEKKKDKQNVGALDWEGPRQCGKQEELHIR